MAKRSIYVYESNLFRVNSQGSQASLVWQPDFAKSLFAHLLSIPEKDRVLSSPNEWFFYLKEAKIDIRSNDLTHQDCIYGWFEGVKIGLITDLKQLSTMATRQNPKRKDESEIRRTYFYLRLKDGLFLLANFHENVVTARRIEHYFYTFGQPAFKQFNVRSYTLSNRVNMGFLEELEKFDAIRIARLRMEVSPDEDYDTSDAIGALQQMSQLTYANYLDIVIGRKNARKNGLDIQYLKETLSKLLHSKDKPISGVIEGSRSDGGSPTLRLKGIEEKHPKEFEEDSKGEVLSEPMFEFIIELGNKCH